MVSRAPSCGTGAQVQVLTWDDAGQFASVTEGGKTTSFVYSADGSELIRRDPGQTTLFAGDTDQPNTPRGTAVMTMDATTGGGGEGGAVPGRVLGVGVALPGQGVLDRERGRAGDLLDPGRG